MNTDLLSFAVENLNLAIETLVDRANAEGVSIDELADEIYEYTSRTTDDFLVKFATSKGLYPDVIRAIKN
jgi:hypothetical protein